MNDNQRAVLFATVAILLIALLFPPFTIPIQVGVPNFKGYSFIFTPPHVGDDKTNPFYASVDVPLLAVEYLILTTAGLFSFVAFRAR